VALRFFIKSFVPAVCVHFWQGRFFVCVSLSLGGVCSRRQAVAVAPDQRRSHITTTPKNTRQGHFFTPAQKSAKVGQVVFLSPIPADADAIGGALSPRHGRFYVPAQKSRKAGHVAFVSQAPTNTAPAARLASSLRGFAPIMGVACLFPFRFFCLLQKNERAHLHIAPQCRTKKPYTTCGIAGLIDAQKRRVQ
jgi:hypothetical protein